MPDYLLLFLQPRDHQNPDSLQWRKEIFPMRPNIAPYLYLDAVDPITETNQYRHLNIYRLTGSAPLEDTQIEQHLQKHTASTHLLTFHWQLYSFITETRQSSLLAATVVTVGITIPLDPTSHHELDQWYAKEHMPALATVSGWQAGIRLQLLRTSDGRAGRAAPSPFLAIHEWHEPNEMGGESWRKAVLTPWSERILELQTAPMERRVWKCV